MIVFLACTKKKQVKPCKAKDMYMPSLWFKKGWEYARSLKPAFIYILSAKYGLLNPEQIIEPYNKTLINAKDMEIRKWSVMVIRQIKDAGIDLSQKAVFLYGKNYRKYLINLFKDHSAPLAHMKIGEQVQFFKEHV